MAELADARDLKSRPHYGGGGSIPPSATTQLSGKKMSKPINQGKIK